MSTQQQQQLKPCPFCGERQIEPHMFDDDKCIAMSCYACAAFGPFAGTEAQARALWDLRVADMVDGDDNG